MAVVMVEREFEEPVEFEEIQAIEDRGAWCLQMHDVSFLRSWFSRDRRRMLCLYEAPDAESVRIAQRKAGMPVARVWAAHVVPPPAAVAGGRGADCIVVERELDPPRDPVAVAGMFLGARECLERHDANYAGGYLSLDGARMICVFLAPDAESVRIANRAAGVPLQRAWSATLHEPGPG